jgi:RNA polymerase sigma-70 factor (ECF subfamily)
LFVQSQERPIAFADFYEELYDQVLSHLVRRTLDPEAAFDLTAESFARAYAYRMSFKGTTDAEAYAWLWSIVRTRLADWYERGRVEREALHRLGLEPMPLTDPEIERVEELVDLPNLRARLADAMSDLPPGLQQAVQRRLVDGEAYADIADDLQMSEDAIRARVSRGLKRLASTLHPDDPDA